MRAEKFLLIRGEDEPENALTKRQMLSMLAAELGVEIPSAKVARAQAKLEREVGQFLADWEPSTIKEVGCHDIGVAYKKLRKAQGKRQ